MIKPYYETKLGKLYHGDCLDIMPQLEPVDLVLTDPPYGISIGKGFNGKDKSISYDDGFSVMFFIDTHIRFMSNIMRNNSAIYIFSRYDVMPYWWIRLKSVFDMKNCIVWSKGGGGTGDLKGNYIGTHEFIMYGSKGRHILNGKRQSNVWVYKKCPPENHPMQKPTDLIENIINKSSSIEDYVLDPFMGSGTTALACERLNRKWIGIEIEEKYCEIAAKRIEENLTVPERIDRCEKGITKKTTLLF